MPRICTRHSLHCLHLYVKGNLLSLSSYRTDRSDQKMAPNIKDVGDIPSWVLPHFFNIIFIWLAAYLLGYPWDQLSDILRFSYQTFLALLDIQDIVRFTNQDFLPFTIRTFFASTSETSFCSPINTFFVSPIRISIGSPFRSVHLSAHLSSYLLEHLLVNISEHLSAHSKGRPSAHLSGHPLLFIYKAISFCLHFRTEDL